METDKNQSKESARLERVFGIILLIPPILSVGLFFINLIMDNPGDIPELRNLSSKWTGSFDNGGYASTAPIYFGLMAIAGAILLKGTDKKY